MDIRKKELYEVFADSLEKSRTKEGGLLFDKLFEDMWEHIEPKLGQSLSIDSVSKCYTEKDMDNAYDKGFKDGSQRDLTGSLIEVL